VPRRADPAPLRPSVEQAMDEAARQAMATSTAPGLAHRRSGNRGLLGAWVRPGAPGQRRLVAYHEGANRGWRAGLALLPDQKAGIVVLANGDGGSGPINAVVQRWVRLSTKLVMTQVRPASNGLTDDLRR
jgi:hypothetical protein